MNKFRNQHSGGFHSRKEHRRAEELKLLHRIGAISRLEFQKKFELVPKQDGERAVNYICDFSYVEADGTEVIEDVKGVKTPDYVIKRKLMLHKFGIRVRET